MATPTDPLFAQQIHLSRLGNIKRIWDEFTGAGVTAVVYDNGVQSAHPDLAANYDASMHFKYGGKTYVPTPLSTQAGHGTSVAGLLGAVHNNGIGGTGVAYGAKITGVNYLDDLQNAFNFNLMQTTALYDAAMHWAAKFDIMSNSWGTDPLYADYQNTLVGGSVAQVNAGHFAWIAANGRAGLGTIVLKAAGNEALNVNGDGGSNSRHIITVAATDMLGKVTDYSNHGTAILVAAPAAEVTTDLTGNSGYNRVGDGDSLPVDYTSQFNGTSASTPVVAGVVALMLDANDKLGWRDVQTILAMSAKQTGSALGAAASGFENDRWHLMGGKEWNGGGAHYNASYGFGAVDAFAAVRMAEAWSVLYGNVAQTSANEVHVTRDKLFAGGYGILDRLAEVEPELTVGFNVTSDIVIDTVTVRLGLTHSYASDLAIFLKGPDGTLMNLLNREGGSTLMDGGFGWSFSVQAFRGMSSLGDWSLVVEDMKTGGTGILWTATLDFYGTANSVNDVYHFTDEFRALTLLEAGRKVISDTNGGVDWLDFAAVSQSLNVVMVGGGAITIGGLQVASFAAGSDTFENFHAGDGNDVIKGNGLANQILGARGNDMILGGDGQDQLGGGAGNDRLYGGNGNDNLTGDAGNDTVRGDAGNDQVLGADGNDVLTGDAGNDAVFGDAGDDMLTGGAGNDTLSGGAGSDQFIFATGFGKDQVTGWQDNQDTLVLDDAIWGGGKTIAQVLSSYGAVVGGSVVLTFNATTTLTLTGFSNLASLSDDLLFN